MVLHWLGVSRVSTSVSTDHQLTVGLDSIGRVSVMYSKLVDVGKPIAGVSFTGENYIQIKIF